MSTDQQRTAINDNPAGAVIERPMATTRNYNPALKPGEGLWCWGCARKFRIGDERPERLVEGLCGLDDCVLPKGL